MPRTLLVRSLINNLRSRWDRFCVNIRGVFRLCIASSSNTGVWVESTVKSACDVDAPAGEVLHSSDSLLSSRMHIAQGQSGTVDVASGGGVKCSGRTGTRC